MRALTTVDRIKLIGFFSLILATLIATVIIPAIDNKISKAKEAIAEFRDYRILTALCKLDNQAHLSQRMAILSEANQVAYISGSKQRINELRQKALNKTIGLAEWTNIKNKEDTKKKISEICDNGKLTTEKKIEEVEKIVNDNLAVESEKLKIKHKERNMNKVIKANLENYESFWNKWFAVLQISGLILFSGAETIDKLTKRK